MEGAKSKSPTQQEESQTSPKISGSESSISSVNNPAVPPVSDDALKVKETKDSGMSSSVNNPAAPPVSDDALKVKETKDSGMSSVNEPAVPAVSDDALKVKETKDSGSEPKVLLDKISTLEEEVVSLKEKLQSLTVENTELKLKIDEDIADVMLYMSGTKQEMDSKEEELETMKEITTKLDKHMASVLKQKKSDQSNHVSKIKEVKMKLKQYMTEISQLKSTHEKKEKIWNGVIGQLQKDIKEKCKSVDELNKEENRKDAQIAILWDEKCSEDILVQQLKTELNSAKSKNLGVLPSFDNVQKLTDELKQKLMELESEVDKQKKALPNTK